MWLTDGVVDQDWTGEHEGQQEWKYTAAWIRDGTLLLQSVYVTQIEKQMLLLSKTFV